MTDDAGLRAVAAQAWDEGYEAGWEGANDFSLDTKNPYRAPVDEWVTESWGALSLGQEFRATKGTEWATVKCWSSWSTPGAYQDRGYTCKTKRRWEHERV